MLDRMAHRGPDGLRTWVDGPVALGLGSDARDARIGPRRSAVPGAGWFGCPT